MKNPSSFRLALAAIALFATAAFAATTAQVLLDAQVLDADYADFNDTYDPNGDCEAQGAALDDLDARHLQLVADRSELGPECDCGEIDALLADIYDASIIAKGTMGACGEEN